MAQDALIDAVINQYADAQIKEKKRSARPRKLEALDNGLIDTPSQVPAILTQDLTWITRAPGKAAFLKAYPSPKDVETALDVYFRSYDCTGSNKIPTMSGLALWLGFKDREDMKDSCRSDQPRLPKEYIAPIRKAVAYIESLHESNMLKTGNHSGSIFWLKNRGWSDIPARQESNKGNTINIIISNKDTDKGLKAALSSITEAPLDCGEAEVLDVKPDTGEDTDGI
jgi:hypothetical protein